MKTGSEQGFVTDDFQGRGTCAVEGEVFEGGHRSPSPRVVRGCFELIGDCGEVFTVKVDIELVLDSSGRFDGGCREFGCTVIGDGKNFDTGSVPVRVVGGGDCDPSWGGGNDCGTGLGENVEGLRFSETAVGVNFDLVKRGAVGVLLC